MKRIVESQKSVGYGIFIVTVFALVGGSLAQAQGYLIPGDGSELYEQGSSELREAEAERRKSQNEGQQTQSQQPENTSEESGGGGGSSSSDALVIGGAVAVVAAVTYFGYRYFKKKKSKELTRLTTISVPISDRAELVVMHPLFNDDPQNSSIHTINAWEQLAAGSIGMKVAF